ncbi:hypothetical protein ACWCQZ_48235 [Streptomyces sp. NPDC002285]
MNPAGTLAPTGCLVGQNMTKEQEEAGVGPRYLQTLKPHPEISQMTYRSDRPTALPSPGTPSSLAAHDAPSLPSRSSRPGRGRRRGGCFFPVRLRRRRRWLRRLGASLLALVLTLCGVVMGAYMMVDIPTPHPEAVVQSTVFLDTRGDYLGGAPISFVKGRVG